MKVKPKTNFYSDERNINLYFSLIKGNNLTETDNCKELFVQYSIY